PGISGTGADRKDRALAGCKIRLPLDRCAAEPLTDALDRPERSGGIRQGPGAVPLGRHLPEGSDHGSGRHGAGPRPRGRGPRLAGERGPLLPATCEPRVPEPARQDRLVAHLRFDHDPELGDHDEAPRADGIAPEPPLTIASVAP